MFLALEDLFWSETNLRTLVPATIGMAVFAALLRRWIGGKDERIRNLPFQILAVVLLGLEIVKQITDLTPGPYGFWSLPLHFSSIYLYLLPFAHFGKGKAARAFRSAAGTAAGMTTIGTLLFPMTIFGDSADSYFRNFGAFHTITFHYAVILYFFLFLSLRIEKPEGRRDRAVLFVMVTLFTAISAPAANLLQTNFTSFVYCGFPPVEAMRIDLREALGPRFGQGIYVLFMYAAILADGFLSLFLRTGLDRLIHGAEKPTKKKAAWKAA